jgi:hypothetical protein
MGLFTLFRRRLTSGASDKLKSEILVEERSPNGNVSALVEQNADTCYFYLQGDPASSFGMKSCWVRNLRPAPDRLDTSAAREGVPPMLPRKNCRHPEGAAPLSSSGSKIVWAEEGDAAALKENGEIIAVIPSWSGRDGFHGYARDCIGSAPLCWELGTPETNIQFERYEKAADYWQTWSDGGNPWPEFRDRRVSDLEQCFGKHSNYCAIDGGKWPPKALVRIPYRDTTLLITVGMALRPQPGVELHYKDAKPYRRIELGVSLDASLSNEAIMRIVGYVSGQSSYPWSVYTFLGNGHTIPSDAFAALSAGAFPSALFQRQPCAEAAIELSPFRGDPVNLLWLTPISAREQSFARQNGSALLAQKLRARGFDWRHQLRRSEML